MTVEEALKMAKADLMCIERDASGLDEMCNSHKCDECSLNYERGNIGEQKEWLRMAIKALERESILDKILAEISNLNCEYIEYDDDNCGCDAYINQNDALAIINKYKVEE